MNFKSPLYKTIRFALFFVLLVLSFTSPAQFQKQFESRYTETGYTDDESEKIISDSDGNSFVLAHSGYDAVLIKYDPTGKLIWSFQAGRGVFMEYYAYPPRDFKIDIQGNSYLLLYGSDKDKWGVCLIKIDKDGKKVWQQLLPGQLEKVALAVHADGSAYVFRQGEIYGLLLSKVTTS